MDSEVLEQLEKARRSAVVIQAVESERSSSGSSVYFAMSSVLGPLSILGIAGNILSIFVLQRDKSGRAMSLLLQALSVGNTVLLTVALLMRILVDLLCRDTRPSTTASGDTFLGQYEAFVTSRYEYLQPVSDAIHMYIVYIVLMIALERYLAAWKPLDRRHLFTRTRVRCYILLVTLVSVAFNTPKIFEAAWTASSPETSYASANSESCKNCSASTATPDEGTARTLKLVYRSFYALVQHFIPMCFISYCNIRLIGELRKASVFGATIRTMHSKGSQGSTMLVSPSLFDRGTTLAFATITCYVICETPMAIATLAEMFHSFDFFHAEAFTVFYGIAIRILDLSACVNLVLYYPFGTKFRTILRQMLSNLCRRRKNSLQALRGGHALRCELTLTPVFRADRSQVNSDFMNSTTDHDFNQIRPLGKSSACGYCLTPTAAATPGRLNSPVESRRLL